MTRCTDLHRYPLTKWATETLEAVLELVPYSETPFLASAIYRAQDKGLLTRKEVDRLGWDIWGNWLKA
jgi:hypothetical protein